eukprot:TRINITY_DN33_c0_g1_i6.p1 TRINITY_DN33_c0_g1~~TRINITY_DN33_c0_g1_i6.p1  ORF type:complete len:133 (-),score=25.47 TRINITY_DN33_c0_g1_i6:87-485(-)
MSCLQFNDKIYGIQKETLLSEVYEEEDYLQEFREYLRSVFAEEVLDFVIALEEVNKDFTQENVEDIISSFIANDCENPICFEYDDDRETIIKKVKSGRYDDSLFRSIGKEMEENLKTHLAQFISSKFYGMSA